MSNDFDFDNEDLGFEDFDGNFEEFDEFETDDVFVRTAVLSKNNMIALLCVKTATEGGAICRVDPREAQPAVQLYDDPEKAIEWFNKSLRTSRQNGWQVVYDGLPLQG
ncbi:MAG TPA: hypothetical protein VGC97_12685 [Pyrinomonadaceae bacterium]|jgi:hypothetical protein